ncbi:uncharacterized protein si:ch211-191i18.2 [Antennarius striatus]|uniref:uncharacterized protein si:ch211-191i18.2 n=1 Tax=Antennarius striatus TaxID=241820 RepID=UPI0035B3FDD5
MSPHGSVSLSGARRLLFLLLLTSVLDAQYDGFTPPPDYDWDYNATFDYSFFSNASSEDLDKFSERFIDKDEEEEEVTGGRRLEEEVAVTTATIGTTTEKDGVDLHNASSLPVSLEIKMLLWTLVILIGLNTQQLQHTLS